MDGKHVVSVDSCVSCWLTNVAFVYPMHNRPEPKPSVFLAGSLYLPQTISPQAWSPASPPVFTHVISLRTLSFTFFIGQTEIVPKLSLKI